MLSPALAGTSGSVPRACLVRQAEYGLFWKAERRDATALGSSGVAGLWRGLLPGRKLGRRSIFLRDEVEATVRSQPTNRSAA